VRFRAAKPSHCPTPDTPGRFITSATRMTQVGVMAWEWVGPTLGSAAGSVIGVAGVIAIYKAEIGSEKLLSW
jgi:hypothetical protein